MDNGGDIYDGVYLVDLAGLPAGLQTFEVMSICSGSAICVIGAISYTLQSAGSGVTQACLPFTSRLRSIYHAHTRCTGHAGDSNVPIDEH